MTNQAVFAGLVFDENDQVATVSYVGSDPCYVVNDAGFMRHIPSEDVDRQVFSFMKEQMKGNEDLLSEQAAKMSGAEDIFSRAMIAQQIKQIDQQFDTILKTGLPEEARAYLGMIGLKIIINLHGEVVRVDQPGAIDEGPE
jgi:hypothetical protein